MYKTLVFFLVLLISQVCYSDNVRVVEVKNSHNNPVTGRIYINILDEEHFRGRTDQSGFLTLDDGCKNSDSVIVRPDNPFYHEGMRTCGRGKSNIVVTVIEMSVFEALRYNARRLEVDERFAEAALVYSEIASREVYEERSRVARERSISNYARAVGLDPDSAEVVYYDPEQKMKVIGSRLEKKIESIKRDRKLTASSGLDYDVLSSEAGADIGEFMTRRR